MSGRGEGTGKLSWADVAVAHQRTVRAFEDFVQPILNRFRVPTLGVTNVLFLLAVGRKGRRSSEVMKNERYVGSNASYALDALEGAALVTRYKDPGDKRMRFVVPTAKGRRLIDEVCRVSGGDEAQVAEALASAALFVSVVTPVAAAPEGSEMAGLVAHSGLDDATLAADLPMPAEVPEAAVIAAVQAVPAEEAAIA